jgi:hypothetical protein
VEVGVVVGAGVAVVLPVLLVEHPILVGSSMRAVMHM